MDECEDEAPPRADGRREPLLAGDRLLANSGFPASQHRKALEREIARLDKEMQAFMGEHHADLAALLDSVKGVGKTTIGTVARGSALKMVPC